MWRKAPRITALQHIWMRCPYPSLYISLFSLSSQLALFSVSPWYLITNKQRLATEVECMIRTLYKLILAKQREHNYTDNIEKVISLLLKRQALHIFKIQNIHIHNQKALVYSSIQRINGLWISSKLISSLSRPQIIFIRFFVISVSHSCNDGWVWCLKIITFSVSRENHWTLSDGISPHPL